MKNRITLIFVLLWSMLLAAGFAKERLFKSEPPGTIRFEDSLYIDKTPVTVTDYLEFLSAIRNSYSPKMHDSISNLPSFGLKGSVLSDLQEGMEWDSLYYESMLTRSWSTYANNEKKYIIDYHIRNPKYYDYPVININYNQIEGYCIWRSDMVKLHYAIISSNEDQRKNYPMNLEFRLPTMQEWEKVLKTHFDVIIKLRDTLSSNLGGKYNTPTNEASPYEDRLSFHYNSYNVAEMLSGYVLTSGFSWDKTYEMGSINYVDYTKPADWLGFRCMCEIIPAEGRKKVVIKKVKRDKFGKIIKTPLAMQNPKEEVEKSDSKPVVKEEAKKTKTSKRRPESAGKKRKKRK